MTAQPSQTQPPAPKPTPVHLVVRPPKEPRQGTTKPAATSWWARHGLVVLALVALVVAIVELVAFGLLGWRWALVVNAALILLVFALLFAWHRRGRGGLPGRMFGALGRTRAGQRIAAARSQWAAGRTTGAARAGGIPSGPGRQRRGGLLGRLTGGRFGRRPAAGRNGSGPRSSGPGRAGSRRGILGALALRSQAAGARRSATPGSDGSAPSGDLGRSRSRRWRNPFRRRRSGDVSATGAAGGRKSRRGQSRTGQQNTDRRSAPGGSGSSSAKPQKRSSWWRQFRKGYAQGAQGFDRKHQPKPDSRRPDTATERQQPDRAAEPPPWERRRARPETAGRGDEPPQARTETPRQPASPPDPRHQAGPNDGGSPMSETLQYSDDQSLQRWGRNLGAAETHAAEVARLYAEAEAAAAEYRQKFGQITTQAETDLPTNPRLKAELQDVQAQANRAASADEWRGVSNTAAVLPAVYRSEHDTDEARLETPRTSRAAERRADVSAAEQDI